MTRIWTKINIEFNKTQNQHKIHKILVSDKKHCQVLTTQWTWEMTICWKNNNKLKICNRRLKTNKKWCWTVLIKIKINICKNIKIWVLKISNKWCKYNNCSSSNCKGSNSRNSYKCRLRCIKNLNIIKMILFWSKTNKILIKIYLYRSHRYKMLICWLTKMQKSLLI